MYDELTQVDIQKMRDEIDYRTRELRPKLIEEVKTARAFGDLSENFEYKAAKREKNRNDSRIKSQGARICDVDINRGRTERSINPNAVFAIRLQQKQPHTQVLTAIAALDSVYTIDEV